MYLPVDAQAQVAIGDKVTGVSTVLARLPLTAPQTESEPKAAAPQAVPASQAAPAETVANPSTEQQQIEAAAAKIQAAVQDVLKD